jgi:outer membrane receptor for ferrienterochelin and colicin
MYLNIFTKLKIHYVILTVFIFMTFSFAQTDKSVESLMDLSLEELMNITITTASKNPQKLSEAPSSITVITRNDIKNWNAKTVIEVLRFIPGFYVENFMGNLFTVSARGFFPSGYSKSAFLMLVDGRPANDIDFGNANFLMSTQNIKQIEIIRGPGSALYGANAFLGVINIITFNASDLSNDKNVSLLSDIRMGENGVLISGINYGKNISDQFSIYSGLEFSRQDRLVEKYYGFTNLALNKDSLLAKKNDDYYNIDYFIKVKSSELNFSGGFNIQNSQFPVHFGNPYYVDKEETGKKFTFADLTYENDKNEDFSYKIKTYVNINEVKEKLQKLDFNLTTFTLDVDSLTKPNNVDEMRLGAESQLTYKYKLADIKNEIVSGIEFRNEKVDYHHTEIPNSDDFKLKKFSNNIVGVFLQNKINFTENFIFYLGGRFDHHSKYGDDFSPRLSAIFNDYKSGYIIKANYSEAFKAPSFHQLYIHEIDPGFIAPEDTLAKLKPEYFKSLDIGGSYSYKNLFTTDLTVYFIQANNEIINSISLSRPNFFYNRANDVSKSLGMEFTARLEKEISDFKFSPFLNLSYSEVKLDTSTNKSFLSFKGVRKNYRSNLKFVSGFNLTFQKNLYTNFVYHYIPKSHTFDSEGSFSDVSVGYKRSFYDVKIGLKNIFDITYYESRSIQLKRYFWLELALSI